MLAVTWMVGKSICGREATGKNGNAAIPTNATAAINRDVATGLRMNNSEKFMSADPQNRKRCPAIKFRRGIRQFPDRYSGHPILGGAGGELSSWCVPRGSGR
jgi:hypothetical protein